MKRYSLYTILFGLLVLLGIIFSLSVYFSARYQRSELIKTAIDEKIRFAKTVSDTMSSSIWTFRIKEFPGFEALFVSQMAQFPDLVFLRIVSIGGDIRHSSIKEEVGQTVEDPDIITAIKRDKAIIKDQTYKEEKIKLVIYPSPLDRTIWVGFSFQGIEETIKRSIIRSTALGLGALFFVVFISYFVFRSIINPLKRMTEACQEIRRGNLDIEVNVKSKTEIGELATTFNQTVKNLKESYRFLREEKDKTQSIITNLTDGLLVLDENNKVILINFQGKQLLSVKEKVEGKRLKELAASHSFAGLTILLAAKKTQLFREELPLKSPTERVLEITTVSLAPRKEQVIILHDVTREKLIEKMKTEFVSLAAHQLRTPLSAIKWTLKMFLEGDLGKITKEQENFLKKTYFSNERMIRLVNDLLDVAKIEDGKYFYKPVLVDLKAIVQFIVNFYKDEVKRKNIIFEFNKPKTRLPLIMIDPEKIKLAIQNVIDNAIRYTKDGGRIEVNLKVVGEQIEFLVKDTGVGIPAKQQNRVFNKFFRSSNAVRVYTEGSGLGLFITKNIIEAHGGKIWFESVEGKGSTFYFTLPLLEK